MLVNKCFNTNEIYNKVIWETKNFKVIPSLGGMVEGWLLVIPKAHYISYGEITDKGLLEELNILLQHTCKVVQKEYGDYIVFEHGAFEKNTKIGCGVDYAHLHIVPVDLNLEKVKSSLNSLDFHWKKVNGIDACSYYIELEQAYLYFQDNYFQSFICTSQKIPSQFFRRIIADNLGKSDKFDWKKYDFLENIEKTYTKLEKYKKIINTQKLATYA